MATMNISLPDSLKEFAKNQTESESYSNPSDYVRSLIREDKEKKEAQQRVEALLLDGLNSGDAISATPSYWKNKKESLHAKLKKNA
jgi:antitoxin ParD1/3/4